MIRTAPQRAQTLRITMQTETLYPAAKVRATFNISGMTLWRWVHKGILPRPIVINKRNFWPESAVQAVIDKGREQVAA